MNKQLNPSTALILPASSTEPSNSQNLIKEYVYHWPLFVVSILITIAAAYYYLATATPIYPITAAVRFTNPTTDNNKPINNGSLSQLDPINNPVVVEDEINVIKSKKLIYQVVENLHLWVDYTERRGLKTSNLYKRSPIDFTFTDTNINLSPQGEKLQVVIKDGNSFAIKEKGGNEKVCLFSNSIKGTFGVWQLKPTNYLKNFIGSTINILIRDPDLVADSYQNGIKVATETKEGAFLNISTSDEVPARGRDILNSLIDLYGQNARMAKYNQAQKTLQFINIRVDTLKRDLDSTERILEKYKNKQGITDVVEDAQRNRHLKEVNTEALTNVNVQLSTIESLENYANSISNTEKLPAGNGSIFEDNSLTVLYGKITDLQQLREEKLAITPEANPLFVSIDRQIAALKQDFKDKIQTKIQTLKSSLLANKQQLQAVNSGVQMSLNKVPTQQKEYNALERDRQTKEELYKLLTSKREELSLQYASTRQDFEVVDDAHVGRMKWPIVPIIYAAALIFGAAIAAGFLYLRKMMNEHISSRAQVEEETEVPVIGEISAHYGKEPLVITPKKRNFVIGEQFRILRTNLYHLLGSSEIETGRVTLFTSSVSGEGKSFISSNLAVTLAYASRKTIILEMDLRKPKVAAVYGLSSEHPGISDYLADETLSLKPLIRPSGISGLDILSCGSILPNPSELIEKERLDEMIRELRKMYDHIIIDSPPVHIVSDALIISRVADASLYVVRNNYTHKDELDFISELNKAKRFSKFTIVFNGVKMNNFTYYNSYNSYSGEKETVVKDIKGLLKRF